MNTEARSSNTSKWRRPASPEAPRPTVSSDGAPPQGSPDRTVWFWTIGLAVAIVVWAILGLTVEKAWFAIVAPQAQAGVDASGGLARLFGALVLFLFPSERSNDRLRWVAGGFVVSGMGALVFGYLLPLLGIRLSLNTLIYTSLIVRCVAATLFVQGLLPAAPPPFTRRTMLLALSAFGAFSLLVVGRPNLLPVLVWVGDLSPAAARGDWLVPLLTGWYFAFSAIPLVLGIATVVGTARLYWRKHQRGWLLIAMVLQAGSQLHSLFWPSSYSSVLTTADLLRLAFAAVVAVGGVLELCRIAAERTALLTAEQEQTKRLGELAVLKADFTAMVAHELGNPLAAIRGFADVLATRQLNPDQQVEALAVIQSEAKVLAELVGDVQAASSVERVDFTVQPRPVSLSLLIADASAFAKTLPADHPFTSSSPTLVTVRADSYRIGQVLRNLLKNAAKYTPAGTPIELRATVNGDRARIEVVDHGNGIHPNDLKRIFEKFGRGRDASGQKVPGVGLGLYLSRRIIHAHGSELEVKSTLGVGSTFSFDLEVVQ